MTHSVVAGLEQHLVSGAAAKADANVAAIKLCNQLDAEKRQPTHEEKLTLAKFTGWGGIWEVFKDVQGHRARAADGMILGAPGNNWQSRTRNQLRGLLSADEFERAKGSILNAHYTAPDVIRGVYQAVKSLGFMGGNTLETSFGLGYWYGFQPEDMRRQSKWTAVELDSLPARIARYLYPEITLYAQGFETVAFPEGCFDAVFGNVPFGSYKVHDPDYNHMGLYIHNYFIARAIHHTRRGGIIALVTSTGTLDAVGNQRFREWMAERVDLIGAVRLPDTAFKKSARTEVTTDVLFLQRRMEDVGLVELPVWLQTVGSGVFTEEDELPINRYYRANPSHILGTLATGKLYTDKSLAVNGDGRNLEEAIAQVFEKIRPCYTPAAKPITFALIPPSLTGVKPGSFCEHEGAVYKHEGFTLTPVTEELPRIRAMLSLRRALEDLINIQIDTDDDAALVPHQEVLLDRYTDFVMTYGFINNHANNRVFAADPNFYALRALEVPDGNGWRRADIFTKRTARPFRQVPTDATPQDALVLCLDRFGRVDIDWIADRVGSNPEDIILALGEAEQPFIFFDPADETWKSADDYLSGNVRQKLQLAQGAGLDRNVRALKAVLPLAVLPPGNPDVKARCAIAMGIPLSIMSEDEQARVLDNTIEVRLGANWIAPHYYEQFVRELFGLNLNEHPPTDGWGVKVTYIPSPVNEYFVKADDAVHRCVANTNTYGTPRRDAIDLINSAMNLKDPVVRDFKSDGSSTVNPEATEVARAKVGELKQAFKDWLWTDGDRAEFLTRLYNDKFNCNRDRVFGSANVSLPGSNPLVTLKSWQLSGAVSICQQKATLLGWCVGAGKTYAMIAGIMEAKRLGLVNKPMLCVLNGTEDQIAEDFRNLYPSANLLVADKDSFHRENRRRFISLIATNSWDCIILTHTQFFGLQMSQSSQTRFLEAEFNQLESYMAEYQNEENPDRTSLKQMLRVKNNLKTRIYKVTQSKRKDNVIDWEQLGVDMLALDECFPYETPIVTNIGVLPIGFVVENRLPVSVLSVNLETHELEWKPIVRWLPKPLKHQLVRVVHEHGSFVCTANHKIWTKEYGYIKAGELNENCSLRVLRQPISNSQSGETNIEILQSPMRGQSCSPHPRILPSQVRTVRGSVHRSLNGQEGNATVLQPSLRHAIQPPAPFNLEELPVVQRRIFLSIIRRHKEQQASILLNPLCSTLEEFRSAAKRAVQDLDQPTLGNVEGQDQSAGFGANENQQPDAQSQIGGEDATKTHWAHISITRWEWHTHSTPVDLGRAIESADRVCNSNSSSDEPIPVVAEVLQGGHWRPVDQISDRGGWGISQDEALEVSRQAEDGGFECSRVVCVEVYEPGRDGETGLGCGTDSIVYDIEVADNHNYFAQGVLVSNCHQFKNLGYITRQYNVAGLPNTHSQRAQDTFMKVRHVIDNGGRVVFATGTPVSNTMAELYTLQRYLDFDYLKELGLEHFDAWSAQFGDTVTAPEISPTGRYKVKTRFAQFVNLPELLTGVRRFASFLMADQLPGLQRPDVMQINIASPPSPELEEFMEALARRADRVSNRQVDPSVDNMLKITTDGRKSALDMRLVDPDAGLYSDTKLHQCAWNVWRIWQETSRTRAAQMVFCDLSTPKSKAFTAYRWLRDIWVALGVPADQIVFIHDYNTPRKRRLLTAQVRAGLVRIVLGSTQKLGTGVNMQTLLLCGHHIDCPWRPSDEEQRNGRFVRQGNLWKKVYIFRYVTEGKRAKDGKSAQAGFDSFMWQTLESKARFIYQLLRGDVSQRKAEDVNEAVMNYAQVKALASGDPMILEKAELENELRSLTLRLRAHDHEQTRIRMDLSLLQTRLDNLPQKLMPLEQDLQTARDNDTGSFELTIGKKVYTDTVKAGNALLKLCKKLMDEESWGRRLVGWFRGLRVGLIIGRGVAQGYLRAAGDNAEEEYTFLFDFNGGTGLSQNILNVVERDIPERIASTQHTLAQSKQRFKELSQESTKPFEQSDRLSWVKDRLLEIGKFLNAPEEAAVTDEALQAEQEVEVEVDIPDEETDTDALDDREDEDDQWLDEDSAAAYNEPPSWLIEALEARSDFPDWLQDIIAQANGFTPPDLSEFATVEVDGRMIKSRPVEMEAPKVAKKRGAKKTKAQVTQSTLF